VHVVPIDTLDDTRLDAYRNVRDPDLATRGGLFIAEGRLVVARLLDSDRFATRSVMVTEAARAALAARLDRPDEVPVYVVPQAVMNGVSGANIHRGCLALGERGPLASLSSLAATAHRVLVLERVANADNVGGLFRNAAAFGVDAVLIDQATTDPLYRKAIRTSVGASLQVPFTRTDSMSAALDALIASGLTLLGLTPNPGAPPIAAVAPSVRTSRLAIVVGHEGDGLAADTLARCGLRARIPLSPAVDSLNVATAAAIALYALA
jgi:tRNA G18 (ribose-2'-O)-methylase SpoU